MAKRQPNGRPPQAQHADSTKPSQHDKRTRLTRPNDRRTRTTRAKVPLPGNLQRLAESMGQMLDARIAFRLPIVIAGMILAGGRRTAASWFRSAVVKEAKTAVGLALDDSPTERYGRHVEAANIHHNPTPGPGDGDWLCGHNRVCSAMVLSHPIFGVIALPKVRRS